MEKSAWGQGSLGKVNIITFATLLPTPIIISLGHAHYCNVTPRPALLQPPAAAADLRGGSVPARPAVLRVRRPVHLLRPGPGLQPGVLPVAGI